MVTEEETDYTGEYGDTLRKLEEWGKDLDSHWGDWKKEAKECLRFVAGHQYTDTERRKLKGEHKTPVTFNRIGPVIDAVVGSEIQGRQRTEFQPREMGDAMINQILTEGAEWIRDLGDADGEESEAKRDAFITGMGALSIEMDYEEDPEGKILYRRHEPGSVLPDCNAKQSNARDKRYLRFRDMLSEGEFKELYGNIEGIFDPDTGKLNTGNSDPRHAYNRDKSEGDTRANMVTVDHWQWYEVETVMMVPSPDGTTLNQYDIDAYNELKEVADEKGVPFEGEKRRIRRYMTCTMTGTTFLEDPKPIKFNKFTFQFITGKRDDELKCWYGLVRPMMDPQKWANAFFSMLLHMVKTNAKGGLLIEEGAIDNEKKFKASFAKSDEITYVPDGTISEKRILPKPQPEYPVAIDRLMQEAIGAIVGVTGVNQEMLGLADRDQPGVLEAQRKQAAYGLLATFFENFRRYLKENGELLLDYIRMLGPNTLLRVTGSDGIKQQYVPALQALGNVSKYDVIVDEAPAGPNQKERTWGMIIQILPVVGDSLTPEMWAEFIKYSPFPESLSLKLREMLTSGDDGQRKAAVEAMEKHAFVADMQDKQARTRKANAEATQKEVETVVALRSPDPKPQVVM